MATSVKLSESAKRLLDRLQAKLTLATGRKVSQQELLEAAIELLSEREDELVKKLAKVELPLPPEEVDALMAAPVDWGVETREEEIDTTLYGWAP